jgi:hypothetical protein
VNPAEDGPLRERFAALGGPGDGDWGDVRRRVRRRGRRLAVLAAATIVALVAAGFGIGGDVIGLFAEHGKRVALSSFTARDRELLVESLCPRLAFAQRAGAPTQTICRDGAPTVEEIANDGVRVHWRVRYPWGVTCLASGPVGGYHDPNRGDYKIGTLGCNVGAPTRKLVPTPTRPITVDAAMGASVRHPHIRLLHVDGLAGRGVATVGLVPKTGSPLTTRVRGSAYSFRSIPDRQWVAITAYDAGGTEVYREPLAGVGRAAPPLTAPSAKSSVWAPGPPARPSEQPLQHAATADAVVDVYRNGVVELRFTSTAGEAYRRLVRTSRYSSGTAGIDCFTVAFGAGRWETLGGGSNARVGQKMGARLRNVGALGGMPSPPFDACQVSGTYGRYWNDEEGTHELVEVPFNAIGRRYLDERATARDLAYFVRTRKLHRIRLAIHRGEQGPSADELARLFGPRVVPLASRNGTVPEGKVGVWTDGKIIVASELTPAGRRLYVTVRGVLIGANNIRDLSFPF